MFATKKDVVSWINDFADDLHLEMGMERSERSAALIC
jgi:hypothetical protein